jgi:hypothetical protein
LDEAEGIPIPGDRGGVRGDSLFGKSGWAHGGLSGVDHMEFLSGVLFCVLCDRKVC